MATSDYASHWIRVWWIGRVERSTHVSKRRFFFFLKIFSVQRGTPRESDTASRREQACLLNPCNVVAQLVTSQPATVDLTLTCFSHTDVLGPSQIVRKQLASSTVHTAHLHVLRGFPFSQTASLRRNLVCSFKLKRYSKQDAVSFIQRDSFIDKAHWKT